MEQAHFPRGPHLPGEHAALLAQAAQQALWVRVHNAPVQLVAAQAPAAAPQPPPPARVHTLLCFTLPCLCNSCHPPDQASSLTALRYSLWLQAFY